MRRVFVELIILGIALGLTVEVIKSAIPYLPLIWLMMLVHYTWEGISSQSVLTFANGIKHRFSGRKLMYTYGLVALLGASLLVLYWWCLSSFFAPRIAKYEAEQREKRNPAEIARLQGGHQLR